MPRIDYLTEPVNFRRSTLEIIELANQIAMQYARMGFNLTLRQLYYQFISRDFFPNTERSYNKLGRTINDARMAGLFDWNYIQDRGRTAYGTGWPNHETPDAPDVIRDAQYSMSVDLWQDQDYRVEVWVEKQALEEVVQRAANQFRVGYFACKGYVSQSEMWAAGRRLGDVVTENNQRPLVIHLGDHDPSGIDMTRDVGERLSLFAETEVEIRRIALNMDQIDEFNPPPNPAKMTDSRFASYAEEYGTESWELDALRPEQLVSLITREISTVLDREKFDARKAEERELREEFDTIADNYADVKKFLEERDE